MNMKKTELIRYLKDVQEAELDVLTIQGVIEDLESQRQYPEYVLSDFFTFLVERIIYNDKFADSSILLNGQILALLIPLVIGLIASIPSVSLSPLAFGAAIGVGLFIAIGIQKKKKRDEYNESLDSMIAEYRKMLDEAEAYKEKLYALDIIYVDYRALGPVSKFRKYIESGLRSRLEGANGAYDLYEQERRHGEVLERIEDIEGAVNQVSQQLEIMTQNQYIQIDMAQECNDKMDTLCGAAFSAIATGQKLMDQVGFIQYNTELTRKHAENLEKYAGEIKDTANAIQSDTSDAAYYAKQTASNTRDIAHNTKETEEYAREIWHNT